MNASNRLIVNTLAQYGRTIVNLALSLYSMRLVLQILGQSDYGLYVLVAGVVSLLSFFTNSLIVSTQRFLSVEQGRGNTEQVTRVFSNSLCIHAFLGILLMLVLSAMCPLFFDVDWALKLNIAPDKEHVAKVLYYIAIALLVLSFITSPFRAALVARENIVYISIVDVADAAIKLILVIMLKVMPGDKLLGYGLIMLGVQVVQFIALAAFSVIKYEECRKASPSHLHISISWGIMSFAGWNVYSSLCIAGRNQGIAIVLNKLAGTIINTAYGIGMQLMGYMSFVSSSLVTAISPQLMKAEGADRRDQAVRLATLQSKAAYLLLAMVSIPAIFETDSILRVWLGVVPEHACAFAVMFIVANAIDQLTTGLGSLINATGRVWAYYLIDYTPKFLILPIGYFLLRAGIGNLGWFCCAFVLVEALCMLLRLPIARKIAGIDCKAFLGQVFARVALPTIVGVAVSWGCSQLMHFQWRFAMTYLITMPCFCAAAYAWSLTDSERTKAREVLGKLKSLQKSPKN